MNKSPQSCSTMAELRHEIDALDKTLVTLLADRARYIDRAIELKPSENMKARIQDRVDEVISNACATAKQQDLDPELIESLWRQIVEWSIANEERVID